MKKKKKTALPVLDIVHVVLQLKEKVSKRYGVCVEF